MEILFAVVSGAEQMDGGINNTDNGMRNRMQQPAASQGVGCEQSMLLDKEFTCCFQWNRAIVGAEEA